MTIESTPDTVITLATTAKVVVAETPEQVAAAISAFRVQVLSEALRKRRPEHDARAAASAAPPEHPNQQVCVRAEPKD